MDGWMEIRPPFLLDQAAGSDAMPCGIGLAFLFPVSLVAKSTVGTEHRIISIKGKSVNAGVLYE